MKYTVIIREAPDGYYVAGCPLVPEAHAQGKSYDECLYNIREALELCIDYRTERGEEIPDESKSRQVLVTL
ncbi:MAG: type II toxin-antitoxin system HicB family antitoxin [Dehalococcoidia bacterium]|jgi:predicted RNase H-like HicB family nuclease